MTIVVVVVTISWCAWMAVRIASRVSYSTFSRLGFNVGRFQHIKRSSYKCEIALNIRELNGSAVSWDAPTLSGVNAPHFVEVLESAVDLMQHHKCREFKVSGCFLTFEVLERAIDPMQHHDCREFNVTAGCFNVFHGSLVHNRTI
eukprot:678382-Amorphochlora_amoeboformis.AAC.2